MSLNWKPLLMLPLAAWLAVAGAEPPSAASLMARNPEGEARSLETVLSESNLTVSETLIQLVHTFPENTADIISASARAGADSRTIASTCQPDLVPEQISSIVTTALAENVEPEPILEYCLVAVGPEDVVNLIMNAMLLLDPLEMEGNLALMLDILDADGLDGSTILVNSLVQGDFLVSEAFGADCAGECLRPFAEELVQNLSADAPDGIADQVDVFSDNDLDTDEPGLSNS